MSNQDEEQECILFEQIFLKFILNLNPLIRQYNLHCYRYYHSHLSQNPALGSLNIKRTYSLIHLLTKLRYPEENCECLVMKMKQNFFSLWVISHLYKFLKISICYSLADYPHFPNAILALLSHCMISCLVRCFNQSLSNLKNVIENSH